MSTRTCVARAFCVVLTVGVATSPDPATAMDVAGSSSAEAKRGLVLDRLSKSDLRLWRAVEEVVLASDASGAPRSPTLRRLWDWARTSPHVLHVEMVPPSKLPAGIAGVFHVERRDPAGRSHAAVIRLCPRNIRNARVNVGPNSVVSFVRFEGLTEIERYAEVLGHELAHAEYILENPARLAELEAAQRALDEYVFRAGRKTGPPHDEVGTWCASALAVLAAIEAHAESVEAVVLRELAGTQSLPAMIGAAVPGADRLYSAAPPGRLPEDVDPPERDARGGVHRWRSRQALDSARTRSWDGSARGAWARSTAPVTLAWTVTSP
jgi:hypothetical protein